MRLVAIAAAWATSALLPTVALAQGSADEEVTIEEVTVELVGQTTWVDPDGAIEVRFRVEGAVPADASVEVTVHEAIRHRTDFAQSLTRERLGGRLPHDVVRLDVGERGDILSATIPIRSGPPDPDGPTRLGMANPGVYPVDVAVLGADGTRLGGLVTHIVRPPLEVAAPPLAVVLVQALGSHPSLAPTGSTVPPAETRTAWTLAASALAGRPVIGLVLAPQPETVAALAKGGPLDRSLVDDLAAIAGAGEMPQMSYVTADLDALLRAQLTEDLHAQLDLGAAVLSHHLGAAPRHDLWLADDDLTPRVVDWLASRGVNRLLVPHEAVEPDDDGAGQPEVVAAPVLVAGSGATRVTALVTDPLLQEHQGSTGDAQLDARRLLADLAWAWFAAEGERRAVVVTIDPDADPVFVETVRAGLAASPLLAPTTATDAFARTELAADQGSGSEPAGPVVRELARTTSGTDLSQLRHDLDLARASIGSFSSVFPAASQLADEFDARLGILPSDRLDQVERATYLVAIAERMDELLAQLSLPERRTITLAAREGTIPLTLSNATDTEAVVAVGFNSEKLEFPDGDRIEVPVPPGTTTVEIDVRARASGAFPLDIVVESPDGRIEMGTVRYDVRSTAVSGLGLALSAAAIIVLAVWWFRTARRARAGRIEHPG